MIAIGSQSHGAKKRRQIPVLQEKYYKSEWLETPDNFLLSPTVSLIEQPAHSTLVPHFHKNNQFQLFVEGEGSLGKDPISPLMVHYAGAYTGYGPLVSGAQGIKYFTMRPVCESGLFDIENHRHELIRGPKKHASSRVFSALNEDGLYEQDQILIETLIPPENDGLACHCLTLPKGAQTKVTQSMVGYGLFLTVTGGSVKVGDALLQKWETAFYSLKEGAPFVHAVDSAAQVVCMHIPELESPYRVQ